MKIALIQQKYHKSRIENLTYTTKMIKQASQNGAKLIVLQELHMSEYFAQCEDTSNFDLAEYFDEDVKYFATLARDCSVVLVVSLFEKRISGVYHNTAVVLESDGSVAGQYRKMHIPDDPGFYEKFYFTPGDGGFEPIRTSVGTLGVMVCWDQWFPEAARIMSLKGAEILIYPTAIGWFDSDSDEEQQYQLNSWIDIQRSHSIANGVYVLSCNRVGFEADPSGVLSGTRFWGHSFVSNPRGHIQTQLDSSEEILYDELHMDIIEETRRIWPFFRDRRVEYYEDIKSLGK